MAPHESTSPKRNAYNLPQTPRIQDLPPEMKPREAFERLGAKNTPEEMLLAILLRSGLPGQNVSALARSVLQHFGGIAKLAEVDYDELRTANIKGLGKVKCMELAAALELGRRIAYAAASPEPHSIKEPQAVCNVIAPLLHNQRQEIFWVILLDTKSRMIGRPVETTRGLLDSTPTHPREVFKKAIRCNAAAIILVHNHPSGDPTPSREDIEATRRLVESARIIGIPVFDHVIVGSSAALPLDVNYVSLRERNLVSFATARH
jgi:DNA repair protein RadC